MKFKLVKKEPVAKNIITFWWQPAQPVRNIAGQYTELYLPHQNSDDRGTKRWFTLSNSPTEELLSITTKFNTERSSSFKAALKNLSEGMEIDGHLPMGDFVLPKDKSIPLLFIAGGIGITPYRSIIKSLVDSGEKRDITLIYAVADEAELAFEGLLAEGATKFIKHVGRLTADDILGYDSDIKDRLVYISGPEPMAEALENDLKAKGIDGSKIRTDFFPNYDKF
jgi:ferredoxin-NADP reductase